MGAWEAGETRRKSGIMKFQSRFNCAGIAMWRTLLYSGFETSFGTSTQGAGTKIHLKSSFCAILTTLLPYHVCRYSIPQEDGTDNVQLL